MAKWRFSDGGPARWRVAVLSFVGVLLLLGGPVWWFGFHGQRPDLILWPPPREGEIFETLGRPIDFVARDELIFTAARRLSRQTGVPIDIDRKELAGLFPTGAFPDGPRVSGAYRDWPPEGILEDLLSQLHPLLLLGIGEQRVQVTTEKPWRSGLNNYVARVHRLDRLLPCSGRRFDETQWIDALAESIDSSGWITMGGLGDMRAVPGGFLATQTPRQHRRIAALLDAMSRIDERADDQPIWIDPPMTPAHAAVTAALRRRIDVSLDAVPLPTAIALWSREMGIRIHLDRGALDRAGDALLAKISAQLRDVSFGSALQLLLAEPLGLAPQVRHGRLWITTDLEADRYLSLRLYPIADLLPSQRDGDAILWSLNLSSANSRWSANGGETIIDLIQPTLIADQTDAAHARIEALLGDLRAARRPDLAGAVDSGPPKADAQRIQDSRAIQGSRATPNGRIEKLMREPASWDIVDASLKDIARKLRERYEINVWIDDTALGEAGLASDMRLSLSADDEPLETALRRMLRRADLRCDVRHETLLVTTPEQSEDDVETRCYQVARLMLASDTRFRLDLDAIDAESLYDLISTIVAPQSWPAISGPGALSTCRTVSTISQTREGHKTIGDLLRALEEARATDRMSVQSWTIGATREAYDRVAQSFARPADLVFDATPLAEVMRAFEERLGIRLVLSAQTRSEAGLVSDTPITADFRGQDLGAALQALFDPWGLSTTLDGRVIRVGMQPDPIIRVHRIGWIADRDQRSELPDVIRAAHCGEWSDTGGIGDCEVFDETLVVRQTLAGQHRLDRLLRGLRKMVRSAGSSSEIPDVNSPAVERIWQGLQMPVDLAVDDEPLADVLALLSRQTSIPIQVYYNITPKEFERLHKHVSLRVAGVPLGTVLESIVRGRGLRFVIAGKRLTITSERKSETEQVAQFYDVADLDRVTQPPTDSESRLPLPWYFQPEASPYGRVQFADVASTDKHVPDGTNPLDEIFAHSGKLKFGDSPIRRIGPAIFSVRPIQSQWQLAQLVRLLRHRLIAKPATASQAGIVMHVADSRPTWQAHDVRDLARRYGPRSELMLAMCVSNLAPYSWRYDDNGWPYDDEAVLCCLPGWIVVRHQRDVQTRIQQMLDALRNGPDAEAVTLVIERLDGVRVKLDFTSPSERSGAIARWIRASRTLIEPAARDAATLLLTRLQRPDPPILDWLAGELSLLADDEAPDETRLFQLCEGIKNYGNAANRCIKPLGRLLLKNLDQPQRNQLIGALAACGEDALDSLLKIAQSGAGEDQVALVQAFRYRQRPDPQAVSILLHVLAEFQDFTVMQAIIAVDSTGQESFRVLNLWSRDPDVTVRHRASQLRPTIEGIFGGPPRPALSN